MTHDTQISQTIPGSVIQIVVLGQRLPDGWESTAIGSRAFRELVRIGFRPQPGTESPTLPEESRTLLLLTLPDKTPNADFSADQPAVESLRAWVRADDSSEESLPMLIQLQGVLICVGRDRIAISGSPDRMQSVTGAALEYFWLQSELQQMELRTAGRWSELEEDTPAAFEVIEPMLERRRQLQRRFQQMISEKARLARLAPLIECPPVWPPTLASQAAERLREKSRLPDRLQFLRDQLEVFERVYEMCGQRISDFISSRKSHTLEWIIVVLLAFETLLLAVDLLSTLSGTE